MSDESGSQSPEQRLEAARSWAGQTPPGGTPVGPADTAQVTDRLQGVIDAAERAAEAIRYDAEEQARRHLADAQQRADQMTAERVRVISQLTDDLIEHASVVKQHSEQMVGALERAINTVTGRLEEVSTSEPLRPPAPIPEPPPRPPSLSRPETGGGQIPTPALDAALGIDREAAAEPHPASAAQAPYGGVDDEDDGADELDAETEGPETGPSPSAFESDPAPVTGEEDRESPQERTEPSDEPPPQKAILRATQLAIAGESRESIERVIADEFGLEPGPVLERVPGV